MALTALWGRVREWLRGGYLYCVLIVAAIALFYLAFNLRLANPLVLLAAGVVFSALVTLFIAARRPQLAPAASESQTRTTLLNPSVLFSEIRAAALVTYGHIGTVTIRKERGRAAAESMTAALHDRVFGEELVMDVGVRIIAGVNLKHLRAEDIRTDGRSVEITLPPTKVLMVYVDEGLTRVVSHKNGWLSGRDISLMDAARREAMEALVNAAIDKDLFEKAGSQAAAAIAGIARSLGYDTVTVHPTLPAIGQHYEELQDPATIARIIALPPDDPPAGLIGE